LLRSSSAIDYDDSELKPGDRRFRSLASWG
jgi:hypothetical protein